MHILMVSHFFESHLGGIERVAGHLSRQMAAQGAGVTWAASAQDAPPADIPALSLACANPTEKLTGLPMPIPGPGAMAALWRAVGRSDAVVVHDALYVTSILAMVMAKLRGRRTVLIQHIAGIPFASRVMRGVMALANAVVTRPMLRAADRVVFISDTVRRDLLGDPARRDYALLFNGVDGEVFSRLGAAAQGLPEGKRRVLFVGRFVEKKGLSILRAVAAMRPDISFMLAGAGPIQPSSWGLANVHDLGPQSPAQLAALYRSADCLLLPSVGEGYPLVIQEAMACGLPVICGAPTHLADPEAGQFLRGVAVDLGDPDGSAARMAAMLDAPGLTLPERAQMAAWAAERYSWAAMARAIMRLMAG
ncbi:glycosyltransferase involved in cell wall biosynthesis [Novosphingobium sp. SG751A]|uniref:glycosyltransferase family 4 protein n=1 Tax=Novosphingobium sp. SG751A TaxID=2587000 RepID=UPI0015528F84|nr:glycosyltransferase family 4 protein [Novosphingobium sp. SG751A]NOW47862.1 glycosyltransferase involved in cell wall biosynthesis [Novosphingobium sp. SG751A]